MRNAIASQAGMSRPDPVWVIAHTGHCVYCGRLFPNSFRSESAQPPEQRGPEACLGLRLCPGCSAVVILDTLVILEVGGPFSMNCCHFSFCFQEVFGRVLPVFWV
jgi:hypothetical protein